VYRPVVPSLQGLAGTGARAWSGNRPGVLQRLTDTGGAGSEKHIQFGDFMKSDVRYEFAQGPAPPLILELLEGDPASARLKIEQLAATHRQNRGPLAFVIAVNAKLGTEHDNVAAYKMPLRAAKLQQLHEHCVALTKLMEQNGIAGGCFPLVWAPTSTYAWIRSSPARPATP